MLLLAGKQAAPMTDMAEEAEEVQSPSMHCIRRVRNENELWQTTSENKQNVY
jgi:hypothetical protein